MVQLLLNCFMIIARVVLSERLYQCTAHCCATKVEAYQLTDKHINPFVIDWLTNNFMIKHACIAIFVVID